MLLNPARKCANKEKAICLHLESTLLVADTRLYPSLLHCSSAQLDSEDQRRTRSHRGKRRLGVPSEREAEALVPLAEGRGAAAAPGRHRWSPSPGTRVAGSAAAVMLHQLLHLCVFYYFWNGNRKDGAALKSPRCVGNSLVCLVGTSVGLQESCC